VVLASSRKRTPSAAYESAACVASGRSSNPIVVPPLRSETQLFGLVIGKIDCCARAGVTSSGWSASQLGTSVNIKSMVRDKTRRFQRRPAEVMNISALLSDAGG
jgi:hypothetical protein